VSETVNVHAAKTNLSRLFEHRDPFDRMLAAQALVEGLPLVTDDPAFQEFTDVETVW
jgi:PIN domain nuclease of toxin-antitoxin system